jgi:hypothetical protein
VIDLVNYIDPAAVGDFITLVLSLPDDEETEVFLGGRYLGKFVGPSQQTFYPCSGDDE